MKTYSSTPQQDDKLSRAIGYSVAFHAALLVAFAVRVVFFPSEPMMLESAIRVDMVALPDKGQQNVLPAPAPEPPKQAEASKPVEQPKPEPVKPAQPKPAPVQVAKQPDGPTVNLKKTKKEQEAALKRLEALERLEKSMKPEKAAASGAPSGAKTASAQAQPIRGNEISHGSSLKGIARLDHENYVQTVTAHVKNHWNLPRWLANANLRAVVKVFVDSNGYVVKKQIVLSSQNETFDGRVMAAIDSSAPFPPPPENLVNQLSVYGMNLDLSPAD